MNENDALKRMVRRFCSISGTSGKVEPGYFALYAGPKATQVAKNMDSVAFSPDWETALERVTTQVESAQSEGHKAIYVRAYLNGGSGYSQSLRMPAGETAEKEEVGNGEVAYARAIDRALDRLVTQNADLLNQVIVLATDQREREHQAVLLAQRAAYQRPGLADGMAATAQAVAPHLESVSQVWADALVKAAMAGAFRPPVQQPSAAPEPAPADTPDARVLSASNGLMAAADTLGRALMADGNACSPDTLRTVRTQVEGLILAAQSVSAQLPR